MACWRYPMPGMGVSTLPQFLHNVCGMQANITTQ
eukprot:CAMPEP_0195005616 /NCGR_PEP_ID=MMETSP0326_2-20130528/5881_1 /TAXON_ID=2866 ORGANISM="Crypthecodinium cohnii, Strain Seligo" /NCGR_SAMPLE_ID=MMETSP0326_2 /ASSEMBLY_ACC=CAM_ASM_000348 /LENGTH=33 /DNA_ID= /DNA_START= /DNA_END= /DNA_ORIENTATION=